MNTKIKWLKRALVLVGLIFIFGVYSMMHIWPEGWTWEPRQHEYEYMIIVIYVTLGFFLVWAAKDPLKHLSLIWFTIVSSFVHATIMLIEALVDSSEHANILGDVLGLYVVAFLLAALTPRQNKEN